MTASLDYSFVIPAYNEEESIPVLADEINTVMILKLYAWIRQIWPVQSSVTMYMFSGDKFAL